jgi:ketosteroid isomerase-like protein
MTTEETRALTERLSVAREAGDAAAIEELLWEDATLIPSPSLAEPAERPSLYAEGAEGTAIGLAGTAVHAFMVPESIKREVLDTIVDGDVSMVRIHMTGDFQNGLRYDNNYLWIYFWRDGKVARVEEHPDTLRYAQMMPGAIERLEP